MKKTWLNGLHPHAVLFPNGKASAALLKALISPYQPVTCDYVIDVVKTPEAVVEDVMQ